MAVVLKCPTLFLALSILIVFTETTTGSTNSCTKDQFRCLDSRRCIRRSKYCNGNYECGYINSYSSDTSDEDYCFSPSSCPDNWKFCVDKTRCYPREWECDGTQDCTDYSDETDCRSNVSCAKDQFRCLDGRRCTTRSEYCNGNRYCLDNSDELFCSPPFVCPRNWKLCADKTRCYPPEWECDGIQDCTDNTDEADCRSNVSCAKDQFRCLDGRRCTPRSEYCNDNKYCVDNSDERYCSFPSSCPSDWKFCADKTRCYPPEWECDGTQDCTDNSDEADCRGREIRSLSGVSEARRNLTGYFLERRRPRRSLNKWGPHLLRTAIALFLADENFFASGNKTGEEISYEISLKLTSKLALKKKIPTQELCLFINALTISCINPKDFFGVDMVAELRGRINGDNETNPFTILTLCNAGDTMTSDDVLKLQQQFDAHHRPLWTDTQALATMTLQCISSRGNLDVDDRILKDMEMELKRRQFKNGTVDNLKTTALVVQAMIATDSFRTEFAMDSAVKYMINEIKQKYTPFNDLYYILPILNSGTLVNISSNHCAAPIQTDLEVLNKLRETPDTRIQVHFSVYIGDDMDVVRTWKLKVPSNYTFYQVLEDIGSLEPPYKPQYSVADGKPYVSGLKHFFDDAEDGTFWFIYTKTLASTTRKLKLVEESPVDVQVKETEELILWYRSRVWADSSV